VRRFGRRYRGHNSVFCRRRVFLQATARRALSRPKVPRWEPRRRRGGRGGSITARIDDQLAPHDPERPQPALGSALRSRRRDYPTTGKSMAEPMAALRASSPSTGQCTLQGLGERENQRAMCSADHREERRNCFRCRVGARCAIHRSVSGQPRTRRRRVIVPYEYSSGVRACRGQGRELPDMCGGRAWRLPVVWLFVRRQR